jgi:hypothetical protein
MGVPFIFQLPAIKGILVIFFSPQINRQTFLTHQNLFAKDKIKPLLKKAFLYIIPEK